MTPPLYDKPSFVRHLDATGVSWRWYTYDVGTLRVADADYRLLHHDNFAYVDKLKLPLQVELEEELLVDEDSRSFLEDAAAGTLPQVSWIDPNFKDVNLAHAESNDDHPPSDVAAGQELVFQVYNAVAASPLWSKSLLIVVYDEHGGFFDHVSAPVAPDDDPAFRRYGVRVPALIVSPWTPAGTVGHQLYDHTSIAKTVLTRFCREELRHESEMEEVLNWLRPGHARYVGTRTAEAAHLGSLLSEPQPRMAPDRSVLAAWFTNRHARRAETLVNPAVLQTGRLAPTDFQQEMIAAEKAIRMKGLPPGLP